MKIIPLETSILKQILAKRITYDKLHNYFEESYIIELSPVDWYQNTIFKRIQIV